jgi:hypothetical protein
MKHVKLFEQFISEAKMPDKLIGNDEIVFLKTKEDSRGAHYNLYYKGHDIEKGGARFGSEKELKAFADDYILSNQWYNKLKYEDSKPLPESVVNEAKVDKKYFDKVVKVLSTSKYPFTVMLVSKWDEIDIIIGYDAPDAISDDIDQRLTKAKLNWGGSSGISISGDSSNYSRREYDEIARINGGHRDY